MTAPSTCGASSRSRCSERGSKFNNSLVTAVRRAARSSSLAAVRSAYSGEPRQVPVPPTPWPRSHKLGPASQRQRSSSRRETPWTPETRRQWPASHLCGLAQAWPDLERPNLQRPPTHRIRRAPCLGCSSMRCAPADLSSAIYPFRHRPLSWCSSAKCISWLHLLDFTFALSAFIGKSECAGHSRHLGQHQAKEFGPPM